jgi:hypothetical protein
MIAMTTIIQSRAKRWVLAFAILIVAGMPLVILNLSFDGFCFRERRFLSQNESFQAAIATILARKSEQLISHRPASINFSVVPVIKYADSDDFRRQNPGCCTVVPRNTGDSGPYTSFDQRLFGHAAKIVSVTYTIHYLDETGARTKATKTEQFAITNCGRAWN